MAVALTMPYKATMKWGLYQVRQPMVTLKAIPDMRLVPLNACVQLIASQVLLTVYISQLWKRAVVHTLGHVVHCACTIYWLMLESVKMLTCDGDDVIGVL